jgi:hypothetical protein
VLRTGLATLLLVLLVPTVVAANVSTWGLRTVLDSGTFSTTVGRALDEPTLEMALADTLADGVVDRVERVPLVVAELARRVGLAAGAEPDAVRAALGERILEAMQEPAVERVRGDVIASVHGQVLGAARGDAGLVEVRGRDVVLDTPRILDRIQGVADPRTAALFADVPPSLSRPIVVAQVAELAPVQRALTIMERLRILLPLVAVTAALLVVLLAHRRARALGIVGLAIAVAGAVSFAVVWGAGRYVSGVPDAPVARQLAGQVYDALLNQLVVQAVLLVAVGSLLAVASWIGQRGERRRATQRMLGPREHPGEFR